MDLTFLGCGSAFNPLLGNTSAYFTQGDQLYIMDAGESVFLSLYKNELIQNYDKITVFITHLHADHVGSLPSLISYAYYVLGKRIAVFYPDETLWKLLDLMGIDRSAYYRMDNHDLENIKPKVQPVAVKHAEDMSCYGYVITCGRETFYYSGDAYEIPDQILQRFYDREIDRIYQDTTEFASGHKSHCPLEDLEHVIPDELRQYVYCMHLTTDFRVKLKEKGFRSVMDNQ